MVAPQQRTVIFTPKGTNPITIGIFTFLVTIGLSRIDWLLDSSIDGINFDAQQANVQDVRSDSLRFNPSIHDESVHITIEEDSSQGIETPLPVAPATPNRPIDLSPRTTVAYDPKTYQYNPKDLDGVNQEGTYMLLQHRNDGGPRNNCNFLIKERERIQRIHFHVHSCKRFDDMFGNRLAQIYGIRLIANALQKPFSFTCGMEEGEKPNGAAYLMNLNSDLIGPMPTRYGKQYTAEEVCQLCDHKFCTWNFKDLDLAADLMIEDWTYLTTPEFVKGADDDDAVIHLRLGDGLYSTFGTNEGKGIFPHATYIKLLRQAEQEKGTIHSIGIVTSPFKGGNIRTFDHGYESLSKTIAYDLVSALQKAFPKTRVRIHNSSGGTIFESQARIVLARKVAICGCSTFCANSILATRGIGYLYNTAINQNIWARNAVGRYENFRLFDAPLLNGMVISNDKTGERLETAHVMEWLHMQNPNVGNVDIKSKPIFVNGPNNR